MDDAFNALVVLLVIGGIVYGVVWIIGLVLVFVVSALLLIGPPVIAGYFLYRCLARTRLSQRQIARCLAVSLLFAGISTATYILLPENDPAIITIGLTTGLFAGAAYIVAEAYRQYMWPHRRNVARANVAMAKLYPKRWRKEAELAWLKYRIRRHEHAYEELLVERSRIETKIQEMILGTHTEMLSTERCGLERRLESLDEQALQVRLIRAQTQLQRFSKNDPLTPKQVLEVALLRSAIIDKATALSPVMSFNHATQRRDVLQREADNLAQALLNLSNERDQSLACLQATRNTRLELT